MSRGTAITGCIAALLAIVLGAFGAHALEGVLEDAGMTEVWKTAVDYQMWHALALVLCALAPLPRGFHRLIRYLFAVGILFFSGSLYWLALGGPGWLGPVTPIGGMLLIVGWILFAIGLLRHGDP